MDLLGLKAKIKTELRNGSSKNTMRSMQALDCDMLLIQSKSMSERPTNQGFMDHLLRASYPIIFT